MESKSLSRLTKQLDKSRSAATATARSLRQRSPVADGLARAWEHDSAVGGGLMAGALAFRLFLFLVPFVLFMFTLLGSASTLAESSATDMAKRAGISGVLATGIVNTESLSGGQKWVILLVAGYAMLMAARSVVSTIVAATCLVWQIPRVRIKKFRPALLFIAFITIVSWLTSVLGQLRSAAPAPGIVLTVAWLAIPLLAGWWLMAHLPHRNAPVWAVLPGALVLGIGLQLMHVFTVVYISRSASSKSETYGVVGVALATLLWCYVAGRLLIATAVINAALWRRFETRNPGYENETKQSPTSPISRMLGWLRSSLGLLR